MIKNKENDLKPMTEKEFARLMAKMTGRSISDAEIATRDFINTFTYAIRNEQPLSLKGFLKMFFVVKPEKKMFSYLTNEEITIPEHKQVRFKLSRSVYREPIMRATEDVNDTDQFI